MPKAMLEGDPKGVWFHVARRNIRRPRRPSPLPKFLPYSSCFKVQDEMMRMTEELAMLLRSSA